MTRTGEGEDHGRDRGRDGGRDHDTAAQPATGLADLIRTERLALVDLLRTLPPQEWETPSLSREIPPAAFVPTADWQAGVRWPMTVPVGGSVRRRIAGVRLVADDLDWSHGHGPEVHASPEALLLVLTGRRVGRDELGGAGAARLREQLSAPE